MLPFRAFESLHSVGADGSLAQGSFNSLHPMIIHQRGHFSNFGGGALSEPPQQSNSAPPQRSVAGRVEGLRERLENSNYILLRLPIEISNSSRGERVFAIAQASL